jgi:hypothetical protein
MGNFCLQWQFRFLTLSRYKSQKTLYDSRFLGCVSGILSDVYGHIATKYQSFMSQQIVILMQTIMMAQISANLATVSADVNMVHCSPWFMRTQIFRFPISPLKNHVGVFSASVGQYVLQCVLNHKPGLRYHVTEATCYTYIMFWALTSSRELREYLSPARIWGFPRGAYEECRLLGYKNPVRT